MVSFSTLLTMTELVIKTMTIKSFTSNLSEPFQTFLSFNYKETLRIEFYETVTSLRKSI